MGGIGLRAQWPLRLKEAAFTILMTPRDPSHSVRWMVINADIARNGIRAQRARKSKGLELYSWVYHIQSECSRYESNRLCKSIRGRRLDMSEALATQRCVSLTLGK